MMHEPLRWAVGVTALLAIDFFAEAVVFEWLEWNFTTKHDWFFLLWWLAVAGWTVLSARRLRLLSCERSMQIFRGERSQDIAVGVELLRELAVGRIEFKEHQCALGASLFHVHIIRRLLGVIPDTPDP